MQLVVQQGKPTQPLETLETIRQRTTASVASLPEQTRRLDRPVALEVEISEKLQVLTQQTQKRRRASDLPQATAFVSLEKDAK